MKLKEIGQFIAECRKARHLTQAQLAEKLNITDRAISKWETGKGMPDSLIMLRLCDELGISVNELLSGKKLSTENYQQQAETNLIKLKSTNEISQKTKMISLIIFSLLCYISIFICLICDFVINHYLSWSLITTVSIIFAWCLIAPFALAPKRSVTISLIVLSILIIPSLWVLSRIIGDDNIIKIGVVVSPLSLLFLWLVMVIYIKLPQRKTFATGCVLCLLAPFCLLINIVVAYFVDEAMVDFWDLLSTALLFLCAFACFFYDYLQRNVASSTKKEGKTPSKVKH